jgi:RNA polymerase sigma-70 factor (ECF subfamily)
MDSTRRRAIHDAMVRLADGERAAFSSLVDELWPVILAFAHRGVGHEQDAEDVAQEVFLRICSRISDFDRQRDGLSWAFGIAAFEVMTHRRRRQRRREETDHAGLDGHADAAPSQEEAVMRRELEAALTVLVGALSAEDRIALGLEDEPGSRTANGPATRKRRQRAFDRLRTAWRRIYGQP